MKPARVPQTVVAPDCWGDLPWGELYRKALERQLNPWFTKMYGFHLLKIGNLSAEINCEACAVSHQVNVSAQGLPVQVRLLREADRVLIDDGWLVISGFNPISLMGLRKLVPVLRKTSPYNSRMFTLMRQLDWLSLLNFEVLHASRFHVLPWNKHGGKLLNAHIPALGCLQLIVARKRTIPLTLNPMKQSKNKPRIRQAVG
ncbi:SAM-dependent methyltransferase, partial [Escherichia coli]|nr:SAM-dependent methyltransferase [Escherichia coli]